MKPRIQLGHELPWIFIFGSLIAAVIQFNPGWRTMLLYDRSQVITGEWWRIYTGHLVHFGWSHTIADAGLFLILGYILRFYSPKFIGIALLLLPLGISGAIFLFDPTMLRYGGLSAINLALLLFVAGQGWQKNWKDWFWPAVLLIYLGELVLETSIGHGRGGGMIKFDDAQIHVATSAHIAAAVCALAMLIFRRRKFTASDMGAFPSGSAEPQPIPHP